MSGQPDLPTPLFEAPIEISPPDTNVVEVVPSTNIEPNGLTRSQASTLNLINGAANLTSRGSSAQSSVPPPPTSDSITPREIDFSPAKHIFRGYISEPKGHPSYTGGYSDVWRCRVWFFAPSEALPQAVSPWGYYTVFVDKTQPPAHQVAVKVLRYVFLDNCNSPDARERLEKRLKQETRTWNGLDHPNIVPLIGWTKEPSLSLITPWYEQGNLSRHPNNLSELEKIRLLLGVSKGLSYLHSRTPPVVHGDIKPGNILLSDRGEPLLTDFGLSTILGEEEMYTSSHRFGGSTPWMAPECIIGEPRSCQSDVYSFGSLAFTVMTGILPHAGLTHNQITLKVCNDKDPKSPVEDWSEYPQLQGPVKNLLEECWARSPDARPSMPEVVRRLTALLASYESGAPTVSSDSETKKGWNMTWPLFAAVISIGITLCDWAIQ